MLMLPTLLFGQSQAPVLITTLGSGKTIEQAKINALRSALEQVSGVYLSSNTLVINDKLISDNITTITTGTINKFEIISSVNKNNLFFVTIKSEIHPKKFAEFISGKTGMTVTVKGSLFAENIKQIDLNERAELEAIKRLSDLYSDLLFNSIYYSVKVNTPFEINPKSRDKGMEVIYPSKLYMLPLDITVNFGLSIDSANKFLLESLKEICLTGDEKTIYKSIPRETYPLIIDDEEFWFRNNKSPLNVLKFNKFESGVDYLNSYSIQIGSAIYSCFYSKSIGKSFGQYPILFTNNKSQLKNIAKTDWCEYIIKGFNNSICNYPCGFNASIDDNYLEILLCEYNFLRARIRDVNRRLWKADEKWTFRINGYFTLKEIEMINDIKIVKNTSPKIVWQKLGRN
jgi:hypothetical protein